MHFWANEDELKLAQGLRMALDKTNITNGQGVSFRQIGGVH